MWCLTRYAKYTGVMPIIGNDEFGVAIDYETGEVMPLPRIKRSGLWTDPVVYGYTSGMWTDNVVYSELDCRFIKYVESVEEVFDSPDTFYSPTYVANGVVTVYDRPLTLLQYVRKLGKVDREIHFCRPDGGFVRIVFKDGVNTFLTKVGMLCGV